VVFSTILLYATLAACGAVIILAVIRYDLHDREPWFMVLAGVALGAGFMFLAGLAQSGIIHAMHASGRLISNGMLAFLAGSTEELGKLSAVIVIALASRRHFNEPLDGLLYGAFAGLGAALEESVWVLTRFEIVDTLPPQEPVRLAGHLIMGGIGGFGLGLLTTRSRWWPLATLASLLGAVALHAAWDVVAFDAADHFVRTRHLQPWHSGVPIALMIAGLIAFRRMVTVASRWTACTVAPRA
jgi:RsiW-degrading membrane proteinase PrsW (M82 family)